MKFPYLLIIVFASTHLNSQIPSRREKCWAFTHPFAAWRIKKMSGPCAEIYNDHVKACRPDCYTSGGQLDAFRHMFYMAAFATRINPRKLRRLGELHEKSNFRQFTKSQYEEGEQPDSLASVMDLRNNEAGFIIGHLNRKKELNGIARIVTAEIEKGGGWMMRRNSNGDYLDCNGNIIDTRLYRNRWYVPKCLQKTGSAVN